MELTRYLKIGLRWWWLILLSMVLSATASYIYSQRQPRIYAARASLLVGNSIVESLNPNMQALGLSRTLAEVYSEVALRTPITQAVIDKLGLDMSPEQLSGMIQTNVIPQAQLLEIFVLDVHPQRARLLADAIANELILQTPTGSHGQQEREKFIQTQLEELQVKIEEVNRKIEEIEESKVNLTSAAELAEAESQLTGLEKLRGDYQQGYNQFLANLSESSPNRLTIFEPAVEPTAPISPNVKKNVAVAAVAGLALAVTAIILLEFFDDTLVWRSKETQSVLGMPVLGAIGKVTDVDGQIVAHDKLWSPEADALRNVRNSIFLADAEQRLTTLLITSPSQGEGKSFLAVNLAATIASPASSLATVIASPGSRVVLVDADLRKPSLHELFDMPNLLGLADILAAPEIVSESMLEKALRLTNIDNLVLLSAGRTPLDPGALLNSPRFVNVLHALSTQADQVIIDSAPLLEAIETKAIANAVDGVVLVVSDGQTRGKVTQKAIDYFQSKPNNNLLGLVFNRAKLPIGYDQTYAYQAKQPLSEKPKRQPRLLKKVWPFGQSQPADLNILTLPEVADHLGISQNTARRWCEQGRIPAIKADRRWSVRLEDLNEFIAVYQNGHTERDKEMSEA